jgi:hypothetical protein
MLVVGYWTRAGWMQVVLEVHKSAKILLRLQRKENFREGAVVGPSMTICVKEEVLNSVVFPDLNVPLEEIFVGGLNTL